MAKQYNFTNRKFGKRSPILGFLFNLIIACTIGAGAYFYFNADLEYQSPTISINHNSTWNQKSPLNISIEDVGSGIKNYKISYLIGDNEEILETQELGSLQKKVQITIDPNKFKSISSTVKLIVEASDNSKWNFSGNSIKQEFSLLIDANAPVISLISHSYSISRGGGATIIAKIDEPNLNSYSVVLNDKLKFEMFPFYKEGYYMSIIPWPVHIEEFKSVTVEADDKAGNKEIVKVPFFIKELKYKVDKIAVSDEFVQNATMKVLATSKSKPIADTKEAFLYANKNLREQNVKTLLSLTSKIDKGFKKDFIMNPFLRLDGSATLANFADKRVYFKNDEKIDEQWHLGTDLASTKETPIYSSNDGIVVFNDYLGIYGNTIVIDHGFGIFSLYAHTSHQDVKVGDSIKANQKIGNTGSTGAVFGDHLHFGILIQGYESDTKEWLDKAWIDVRVKEVIEEAKRKIDNK